MLINKKTNSKRVGVKSKGIYNTHSVTITMEENIYGFDIYNKLYTNDVLEAVAFLMKYPSLQNEEFWNLEITEKMLYYINPMNTIYWLSGGDEFWDNWEFNWAENIDLYSKKFENEILKMRKAKTLNDIREVIQSDYNLDIFYEFALSKEII
jgi:hypothetical protein